MLKGEIEIKDIWTWMQVILKTSILSLQCTLGMLFIIFTILLLLEKQVSQEYNLVYFDFP